MRTVLLLLLVGALLVAGCTTPDDPPADAAAEPTPTLDPVTPASDAAEDAPEPTTPASPPDEPEPEEPAPEETTPANETEPAPAPAPQPWELAEQVAIGWLVAVGSGGSAEAETVGQGDATHCPDATFLVPEGAQNLTLAVAATLVDSGGPAAGQYVIRVTAPDGTATDLAPEQPNPGSEEPEPLTWSASAPAAGAWTLSAIPVGPVVQQNWPVAIAVAGASIGVPSTLGAANTC